MAYIQGQSRSQTSLFPVSLEELIPEDHLVRVIDLYVAKLDLVRLGFDKALPKSTGRPSYDPADQLKLTSTVISSGSVHHGASKPSVSAISK
jgi:transposase